MDELQSYSAALAAKSRIVIGTKLDMPGTAERLVELQAALPSERVVGVSAFSRAGLQEAVRSMHETVVAAEKERVSG